MLTQAELKAYCTYNPETGVFIALHHACNNRYKPGRVLGSHCLGADDEYLGFKIDGKVYGAHRLAWLYVHGELPAYVDHKNGNTIDNRIENLRPATQATNAFNKRRSIANTSGVKGVTWRSDRSRWEATVIVNGKRCFRRLFATMAEAEQAIKAARVELHGEFANHG